MLNRRPTQTVYFIFSLIGLLILTADSWAQSVTYESTLSWVTGDITTRAQVNITEIQSPLPAVRQQAEIVSNTGLIDHIVTFVKDIPVTSSSLVGDLILRDSKLLTAVYQFAKTYQISQSYVSSDVRTLHVTYIHRIFPDLASLFVTHTRVARHEPYLGYSSSTVFTGIVIYARGELPVHGESGKSAQLAQSIRPRIYDESMRLLYDPFMATAELITAIGAVAYTSSSRILDHRERIGDFPIVTMARGIFGELYTDLIIPDEIAQRILSSPENRTLLRDARIIVICDSPTISN